MSPYYAFERSSPLVHPSAFVHPEAVLIGDVRIEAGCYVGPCASLRADFGRIVVGSGSNIQDCCVLHCFPGRETRLGANAHVGHGAILHGCTLERDVLIGMNAVLMDEVVIAAESFVGANSFIKSGFHVPERHLAAGSPATVLRRLTDEEIEWKAHGTKIYQELAERCRTGLRQIPTQTSEPGSANPDIHQPPRSDTANTNASAWQHVPLREHRTQQPGGANTDDPADEQ
jgi:carbonic anhydrase/acetyltransferase-like protein (isoleucine patch superfamily)